MSCEGTHDNFMRHPVSIVSRAERTNDTLHSNCCNGSLIRGTAYSDAVGYQVECLHLPTCFTPRYGCCSFPKSIAFHLACFSPSIFAPLLHSHDVLWQFSDVANAHYPDVYERFLNVMDYFNFDLGWVLSTGCILDFDFHDRLLTSTIGPLVVIALLGCTYAVAMRRADESATPRAMQVVRQKHMSMLLLVTFLVYSSVSAMIFRMFACEALDDEKTYLTADYRIECDSPKHRRLQIYSAFMVIIYPIGIPLLYAVLLFQSRADLKVEATRGRNPRVQLISDLWQPYTPQCFYYEVVECGRRIMLTGVVVFIFPNTAAQIAITLVLAFAFYAVLEILAPYASSFETWTARTGHVVVFFSMYVALLLRVDVSQERTVSQGVFAGVLVAAHVCMIVAVVAECCIMAWSLKEKQARQASVVPKPSSTEIPPPAARP